MFYTKKSPSCGGNCCWYWMPIKKSSGFYRISYYKPEWKRKEISKHDASYTVYTLVRVTLRYLCKCVCVSLSDLQLLIHSCAEVHRTTAKWAIDTFVSVRWGDTRLKLSHLWAHTKQQTKRIEKRNSNNLQRKIQKEKKIKKNKKLPKRSKESKKLQIYGAFIVIDRRLLLCQLSISLYLFLSLSLLLSRCLSHSY